MVPITGDAEQGGLSWLLLTYKVPSEPAAKRIALWRRLKGMGGVYLQNGVCLLPKTDDHIVMTQVRYYPF